MNKKTRDRLTGRGLFPPDLQNESYLIDEQRLRLALSHLAILISSMPLIERLVNFIPSDEVRAPEPACGQRIRANQSADRLLT